MGAAAAGGGPVVVDSQEASNTGHRGTAGGLVATANWSFTNTAGTLLIVGVVGTGSSTSHATTLTTPTANSTPMTLLGSVYDVHGDGLDKLGIYYVLSPPTGSVAIVIAATNDGVGSMISVLGGAISFTGNSASSPLGTIVNDSATSGTHALSSGVTTASGNYVFGVGCYGAGSAATADSGQSATYKLVGSGGTSGDDICAVTKSSTGSSIALGFTWSGSDNWGISAVAVQA